MPVLLTKRSHWYSWICSFICSSHLKPIWKDQSSFSLKRIYIYTTRTESNTFSLLIPQQNNWKVNGKLLISIKDVWALNHFSWTDKLNIMWTMTERVSLACLFTYNKSLWIWGLILFLRLVTKSKQRNPRREKRKRTWKSGECLPKLKTRSEEMAATDRSDTESHHEKNLSNDEPEKGLRLTRTSS